MKAEAKELFTIIHEEYENQFPTIRGETPYAEALLDLQHRLLRMPNAMDEIKIEYEKLKQEHSKPAN